MKTLGCLMVAVCVCSSALFAYDSYTVTNGLGQPDQVGTGLTVDQRTGFVKNQDKDGYLYLVGYSGVGNPRTQSVWRIAATATPAQSADAWEFVLGGIPANTDGGENGQVWVKLSNTFYSAFYSGGASPNNWAFYACYATNSVGQPAVGATAVNPKAPVRWKGSEGWTACGQNVGAIVKRTSNDDLVYAGIKRNTDGQDLQIKKVASASHTVTKLWERTTTTNNSDYSTTIYDGAQAGRVLGVYSRNAINPGNAVWCVTNINQLADRDVWVTTTITNGLTVDHRGGIVKNYDAPDGYIYVYGLDATTPAVWRRLASGGLGNWEPVVRSSNGGGEGYQTWVKKGNVFYSSFWGAPNSNWGHKWAYLTNGLGQIGIGGAYTNLAFGSVSSWSVCGQNMGAVLNGNPPIDNIEFIGTARSDAGNAPDIQAVRLTATTRTLLGATGAEPGQSNRNDRSECVMDDAYNGRAFFIFANYTNVYCATNLYAGTYNVSNVFVAVVLQSKTTVRASVATTTVKGKKVLVVSYGDGSRKLRVFNVDTLGATPIYSYADVTPSSVGNNANDRWSVGFAQMGAGSTKLYATWDNGATTPQGNVYEIDLDKVDLSAIGIGQAPAPFALVNLPGNAANARPVDLELVDLSQEPAVSNGTLVVVSVVTNGTERGVFMFNADQPDKGLQDITPASGLEWRGRLGSSGSKLFVDGSLYGTDVKTEFSQKLIDLGFTVPEPAAAALGVAGLLLGLRRRV